MTICESLDFIDGGIGSLALIIIKIPSFARMVKSLMDM